jgi:hypothetical protein
LQNSINQIRQTYENTRKEVTPNRKTLQPILDDITYTRTHLVQTTIYQAKTLHRNNSNAYPTNHGQIARSKEEPTDQNYPVSRTTPS